MGNPKKFHILKQGGNPPLKPRYEKGNIKLNFSIDYRINHYWITSRSKLFITMAQQTAKEKAAELINRYIIYVTEMREYEYAKQCALIAVDEILDTLKIFLGEDKSSEDVVNFTSKRIMYWEEVKQEIEKL